MNSASAHLPGPFWSLRLPVLVAPMFLVSGVDLVVATLRSGVIGTLPAHNARSSAQLANWIDRIFEDAGENAPLAVNLNVNKGRAGTSGRFETDLAVLVDKHVPIIITSVGEPSEVVQAVRGYGGRVFHDVINMRHAEKAITAGVHGLVLVCAGAGGHSGDLSPFVFVPAVRRIFDGLIVLGGGISTGRAIRAARVLGADLVSMGTRFLATQESLADDDYKKMVVAGRASGVCYTPKISGVRANFLTASMTRYGLDPNNLPDIYKLYRTEEGKSLPKPWKNLWSAGQGVDLIDDVPLVAELVDRLSSEYQTAGN